ncbi:hypothetical protein GTP38_05805 [Duganella sp. FT94W]|uniref:DUF3617 family protein n=1 Tax=Duganella lactea TaxID=2692173 RepID=A0ABW9V2D6_9BURK|nr:STY0301 family protein [Duganella lactea]MYM33854.1 hypothetical protein [Duganella lactea]
MFIERLMCASLIASPLLVSAATLQCPALIPASAIQLSDTEADWLPHVASPLYLHAAAPMSGPPEMKGDLADFKASRSKKEWSYTYALEGTFPNGKWLQCTYGERNQVTLSRRLPDDTQECKFTYRKGAKAGQHDITTLCR